jgi:hypothetical protein
MPTCECGHDLTEHNRKTPNRDLRLCGACDDVGKRCIVHQAFQPAGCTTTHVR